MKVKKEIPFISSLAFQCLDHIDFSDTFSVTNHKNTLKEISILIFGTSKKWVKKLFDLRNFIVKIIGIKEQKPKDYNNEFKVGGYIGLFKIYEISKDEIILGLNDSHLNFRVSVYNNKNIKYNIKITTLVKYNNTKGKIYMKLIKPFHECVIKSMVKQAYSKP